jgi:hypothetical protein
MVWKSKSAAIASGLFMGLLMLGTARASTVSYSGTLSSDDQVQTYSYSLNTASSVVFSTNSYAAGGFVPVISLFGSTGTEIGSDGGDGTCQAGMSVDSTTKMCDDAYLSKSLAAGTYTVAVSEFFNVPVGPALSNGFLESGQGNFTGATCGASGGFYQTDIAPCVQRTNAFSLSISSAAATSTPEPSTLWLAALPFIAFGVFRRRNKVTQN